MQYINYHQSVTKL